MKNKKIYILTFVIFILFLIVIPSFTLVTSASNPIDNPEDFAPGSFDSDDVEIITDKASIILNSIVTIGIVASVITLIIIGIKYMIGSVEEKAEYKKTMIPYIIGVVILLSTSTIVGVIYNIVNPTTSSRGDGSGGGTVGGGSIVSPDVFEY